MAGNLTARSSAMINASPAEVWAVLTDPEKIGQAFFGATVKTDWQVGSPITWSGEFQGKQYEDKGEIRRFEPEQVLEVTHFSPLSGQEDVPENYHVVTFELAPGDGGTELTIKQSGVSSAEEREHVEANWAMVVDSIRKLAEK